jgi:hypothetical protein
MSTNSKWYTLKVDPTTVTPDTFQRYNGKVVNEDFLMHAPDTDELFFCIEIGGGKRHMIPTESITPLQAYLLMAEQLIRLWHTTGDRVGKAACLSEQMHEAWSGLTKEEEQQAQTGWEQLVAKDEVANGIEGTKEVKPDTNSNWYEVQIDVAKVSHRVLEKTGGSVVHEDDLMPAEGTTDLFFCLENGPGRREMIPTIPMTPLQAYLALYRELVCIRRTSGLQYTPAEATLSHKMTEVWFSLTAEDKCRVPEEYQKICDEVCTKTSLAKRQDPQEAQPCN